MIPDKKKKLCVIGYPVSHSLSPFIHNCWYKKYGMDAAYEAIDIGPDCEMDLSDFFSFFSQEGFYGSNVTIPHKRSVMPFLDSIDEDAQLIGAVNTIFFQGDKLHGSNTDGNGFLHSLKSGLGESEFLSFFTNKKCVLFGAGGASRAIGWALSRCDFSEIIVVNRSRFRGEELVSSINFWSKRKCASYISWEFRDRILNGADLIVNGTSLGMDGDSSLDISLADVSADCVVVESVYRPLITSLLDEARGRGLHIIDGLGMLLHQGALSFEIWFGFRPCVDFAYASLLDEGLIG